MGVRLMIVAVAAACCAVIVGSSGTAATASQGQTRPSLSPILATFFPDASTTFYSVRLSDAEPGDTGWSYEFTPPADDPTCNKVEEYPTGITRTTYSLKWAHHADDGCNHAGTEHLGRITITARSGTYECRATITGTTSHEGPAPDPCFKLPSPPPPPPPASSAPSMTELEKRQALTESKVLFAGGASMFALAIGCALVPSPDPVSKGLALVGALVGLGHYAIGFVSYLKSEDPPDANYQQLAKLVTPRLRAVKAGAGVTAAEAAAANALSQNLVRIVANDAAFVTSFERAQGAYAAANATWDRRQSRAAAGYARAEAKLLDARSALERALRAAVARAKVPPLTQSDVRRAVADVAKHGLPPSFAVNAKVLGVDGALAKTFASKVAQVAPGRAAGTVATKIGTPAVAAAYRSSAKLLRAIAARLDTR